MLVQEVSIELKNADLDFEKLRYEMEFHIGALVQSGQLQRSFNPIFIRDNFLVWHGCVLEKSSLSPKNDSIYTKRDRKTIEKMCGSKFKVSTLGSELSQDKPICRCKKPASYVLWTNYISIISPLDCGDCGGNVPLYRIPKPAEPGDQGYYSIICWNSAYRSCDNLQMGCGFGERWAMREMRECDSGLSKEGREVAEKIEELTGSPVYYYLHNYRNITIEQDRSRKCPECGGKWLLKEPWHGFDFKCKKCRLVSHITSNAR